MVLYISTYKRDMRRRGRCLRWLLKDTLLSSFLQALMVDLGTDRFIRQVRQKNQTLQKSTNLLWNVTFSVVCSNIWTHFPNIVVYFGWLECLWMFIDGRWGLAVAAETSVRTWASSGAEEWHHQSGLWQRVRRRWVRDRSSLSTKPDVSPVD